MRVNFIFLSAALLLAASAPAATWTVPGDAPTIAGGLALASAGDVVEIACGTYHEHDLVLPGGITVRSVSGDAGCVTIDAQSAGGVFLMEGPDAATATVLEGLTITGGARLNGGGLCWTAAGALEIRRCAFVGNAAVGDGALGGALYWDSRDDLTVSDTVFRDNTSASCSIMYLTQAGNVAFTGCTFRDNHAAVSGGIPMRGPTVFDRCLFWGNTAPHAPLLVGGYPLGAHEITCCTFYGNAATDGGLFSCGFGEIMAFSASVLAFNEGSLSEGTSSCVRLTCCCVYPSGPEIPGDDNFAVDPCFCDPDNGDFTLAANSYCLPAFSPAGCQTVIGACGQGCDASTCSDIVPGESTSWGEVKARFLGR